MVFVLSTFCLACGSETELDKNGYPLVKDVKIIYCKEFSPNQPKGWTIVRYETRKKYPLYRGGFYFTDINGVDVLNTNCSYSSRNK